MKISLFSFGFKYGQPEADMVLDVRFLPNPYWVPELKEHTGVEELVAAYVLKSEVGREFLAQLNPFLAFILNSHKQAGRQEFTCAIGCTGGRHRSVAVTEHLRHVLTEMTSNNELAVSHRDIHRE
ncbi:MAG: P-loop ATPase protein family protein [Candidatus Electronema aureum]|uniref:P-loop ATPase protein family protein n=1 Tax=Candidatus Electronema aureum TaxID=2005002 RepID=A0A521G0E3_9BACT|nr:MAG: P-loop ATPase protein family protein [Candidatus Electronema aureum]